MYNPKLNQRLFTEALRTPPQPRKEPALFFAFCLALLVYGVSLGFAALSVWLLFFARGGFMLVVWGLLLGLLSWMTFPRPWSLKNVTWRPKLVTKFPLLLARLDQLSIELGVPRLDGVSFVRDFGGGLLRIGWLGRRVLCLSLPHFSVLTEAEQAALLVRRLVEAHHPEPRASRLIYGAWNALASWYQLLYRHQLWPQESARSENIFFLIGLFLANLLSSLGALLVRGFWWLMETLIQGAAQRSIYLADQVAAQKVGTTAIRNVLCKSRHQIDFELIVQKAALAKEANNIFQTLQAKAAATSPEELHRRIEAERAQHESSFSPSLAAELQALEAHPIVLPAAAADPYRSSAEENKALLTEISQLYLELQKGYVDRYLASLG